MKPRDLQTSTTSIKNVWSQKLFLFMQKSTEFILNHKLRSLYRQVTDLVTSEKQNTLM